MRPILLGPFGSMGSMNNKLRTICIEDMMIESFLSLTGVVRVIMANTEYEYWGAVMSLTSYVCIAIITSILVLDGGFQCFSCRKAPVCVTPLSCCTRWFSDHMLVRIFFMTNQIALLASFVAIITEAITLADPNEHHQTIVDLPVEVGTFTKVMERDNAIAVIIIQVFISIPWRVYTLRVVKGVLDAIYCTEVLQFPANYSSECLRKLLPDVGLLYGVDLAREADLPTMAAIYYTSFQPLFEHMGLPSDCGPEYIISLWRSQGPKRLQRWLNRVGVIRNEVGVVVGLLALQLPGDVAAYEQAMLHDDAIPPPLTTHTFAFRMFNLFRFRYKHAILRDHVCTPGEAYVDYLCVDPSSRQSGVGSRLIQWAEHCAEYLGCGYVALNIWNGHKKAFAMYLQLGYQINDDKSDCFTYHMHQLLFGTNEVFYDMDKELKHKKGYTIKSNLYGYKIQRDDEDALGFSIHSAFALLNGSSRHTKRSLVSSDDDDDHLDVSVRTHNSDDSIQSSVAPPISKDKHATAPGYNRVASPSTVTSKSGSSTDSDEDKKKMPTISSPMVISPVARAAPPMTMNSDSEMDTSYSPLVAS